ncbi:hypothetical protein KCP71_11110 [Salmonella enterica subsp. enterica]|nr:hypothetical protein KCP71_11110 [Salmonella enterica subsp. enterica]
MNFKNNADSKSKLVIAVRHNAACQYVQQAGDINARRRAARGAVTPELTEKQLCHPELDQHRPAHSIFLRSSRKALWSHPYGFAEEE